MVDSYDIPISLKIASLILHKYPFLRGFSRMRYVEKSGHINKNSEISMIVNANNRMIPFGIEGKWRKTFLVKLENSERFSEFENIICLHKELTTTTWKTQIGF